MLAGRLVSGLFLVLILPFFCFGQHHVSLIAEDVVHVSETKLLSTSVQVVNNSKEEFRGEISALLPAGYSKIGDEKVRVSVAAGGKTYYPFKFLILNEAAGGESAIKFILKDSGTSIISTADQKITLPIQRMAELILTTPGILLKNIGDSLKMKVLVRNAGNQKERLKVVASFPNDNGEGKILTEMSISLTPGAEQEVVFTRVITKNLYQLSNFYINVAGLYSNGDLFGNGITLVQNGAGERNYVPIGNPLLSNIGLIGNQVSLSGQNLFSDSQSWQLNGSAATQMANGILSVNVDAYQWREITNKPLVSNTWINFENRKFGVTVGNISENLESFINGRGARIFTKREDERHGFEFAMVQKSFNLLGDNLDYGYATYAKTLSRIGNRELASSLTFEHSPQDRARTLLTSHSATLLNDKKLIIRLTGGAGLSQDLLHQDVIKPAMALGVNASGSIGKYSFTSNNFYSSAYYPGIRRGVMQFNERLSRYYKNKYAWIGFSHYSFDPEYHQTFFLFQRDYSLQRYETGIAQSFRSSSNLTLTLAHDREKATYNLFGFGKTHLNSLRLNESFNWHSKNYRNNIFITLDNGFSYDEGDVSAQLRLNASWTHPWFNFSVYWQKGSFLLAETINSGASGTGISRYSISPSFRHEFFRQKLMLEAGLIYYDDSIFGNNGTYNLRAQYKLSSKNEFYIGTYQYRSSSVLAKSSFQSLVAGVTQKLPAPHQHVQGKKSNLELFVYLDKNQNDVFDEGDVPAENYTTLVNRSIFVASKGGLVKYNKVPYGSYTIAVPLQQGYQTDPLTLKADQKTTKLSIPLHRSGNVTGSWKVIYDKHKSVDGLISLAGMAMNFQDDKGKIRVVRTDPTGSFSIYLPVGKYKLLPDQSQLPQNTIYGGMAVEVSVTPEGNTVVPVMLLNVKEKKVEIKRFKS